MAKYRCSYEYSQKWGKPQHVWTCIGAHGALHLHIHDAQCDKYGRYSGGIEIHYRTPPEHMADDAPSSDDCWLLKCPCWHDGSSLQATEDWIPFWLADPHDHDGIFKRLESEMSQRFETALSRLHKLAEESL